MTHAVVLLSGGLDSTTVAAHAVDAGYDTRAISIRYGQRHVRELAAARAVAAALGIPLTEIDASFYGTLAGYSALTSTGRHDLPARRTVETMGQDIPITYVPLRNTFFVTAAAAALESWMLSLVEEHDIAPATLDPTILVGANAIDYSGYPDCRPEFYDALVEVLRLGSKLGSAYGVSMRIEAPIITMAKVDIVHRAVQLGAPIHLTWSCYAGGEAPCGSCDSCEIRATAFAGASIPDPALPSP